MADHSDLIAEMPIVLQMSAENRIRHARQRRNQQLNKWLRNESLLAEDDDKAKVAHNIKRLKFYPEEILLDAVQRADIDEVKQLMKESFSPNIANPDGFTAIHQCSLGDRVDILETLLENGANINIEDNDGWTPLHAAFACNRLNMVRVLIEHGANLLALDHEMNFPFEVSNDDEALTYATRLLQEKGITSTMLDEMRQKPESEYLNQLKSQVICRPEFNVALERIGSMNASHLHISAAYNFSRVAEFLISIGAEVDCVDSQEWTPLHAAVYFSQQKMIEILIKNGADPDKVTDQGLSAFDLCCDYDIRQWMFELASTNRKSDMRRRKTLPVRESSRGGLLPQRISTRRYSLRENKKHRKHDDDFHFVITTKLWPTEKMEDESVASAESFEKNVKISKEDEQSSKSNVHQSVTNENKKDVVMNVSDNNNDTSQQSFLFDTSYSNAKRPLRCCHIL